MRTMKKYILGTLAALGLLMGSCGDEEVVIFDVDNGQTLGAVTNGAEQTLPVPDTGDTAIIRVGVTTVSNTDRAVSISVNQELTTAAPAEYTIDPASLVIPAGEYEAEIRIDANFDAIPETGVTSLVVNIDDIQGADILEGQLTHQVNFFRFCPFQNGATFTGDYQLEMLATGIFDSETLANGVVSVSQGATVADRSFSVVPYPGLGTFDPFTFSFSLICGEVVVVPVESIGVGCGGGNAVGPSATVVSTYDETDDSEFIINFVDDVRAQCQGVSYEVSFRLTKI